MSDLWEGVVNFPIRYSIHGPDADGTWSLTAYRFKWELCPEEGSYIPHRGPFTVPSLEAAVLKTQEIEKED